MRPDLIAGTKLNLSQFVGALTGVPTAARLGGRRSFLRHVDVAIHAAERKATR